MPSTYNEGELVIIERFLKTLRGNIYKKMAAKNRKSYFAYFNKLVDQYNNTYYHSIGRKCIIVSYSALNEKIEKTPKAPKFELNDRVTDTRIDKYKNIFSKCYNENW